ncbi:hypothetical protein ABH924_003350 [Arthrobacter sp. GAS37]|uniref:hypothetical protein n=1 Tax=Arthrobacter sp. GAS37 TaxID=3156261 RepID=UPI003835C1C8
MSSATGGLPPVLPLSVYTLPAFLAHPEFTVDDVASRVLSALLHGTSAGADYRGQLEAVDARLRGLGAGFLRGHTIHLFPRQALHAAKAAARERGGMVSASASRFEASLIAAGWADGAPGPVRTDVLVNGKRRTVWTVPAYVQTHAGTFTPAAREPVDALRALTLLLGLDFTARLAGTSRSSVENWLYAGVPITVARRQRLITSAMIAELLTAAGTRDPVFWLTQPSKALLRVKDVPGIPLDALEAGVDHQVLLSAALRSCAASL